MSVFIDPDRRQIEAAKRIGAHAIEIHTGAYAEATRPAEQRAELARITAAAEQGRVLGLLVNAGHGLTLGNVRAIAALPVLNELNMRHSIVARALFVGMEQACRQMKERMRAPRRLGAG